MLSLCPFDISVGVGAFVMGLSQISSFFSSDFVCKVAEHSFLIILKGCLYTGQYADCCENILYITNKTRIYLTATI